MPYHAGLLQNKTLSAFAYYLSLGYRSLARIMNSYSIGLNQWSATTASWSPTPQIPNGPGIVASVGAGNHIFGVLLRFGLLLCTVMLNAGSGCSQDEEILI